MARTPKRPRTGGDPLECRLHNIDRELRGLADLLLPFALIEDGILLQQDGSLLAGWSYRGPDMHSATHSEMHALTAAAQFHSPAWQRLDDSTRTSSVPAHLATRIRVLFLMP